MIKRSKCAGGFTLIEMLIALAILSIILVSVYGTFFSVNRAVVATDGDMVRFREIRIFFDLIRREIQSSYIDTLDANTFFQIKDRDVFGMQASEIAFTSFVPYGNGLFSVEYSLDKETNILYKNAAGLWSNSTSDRFEALEEVDEFRVEARAGGKWVGTYDTGHTKPPPSAVRVTLKLRVKEKPMVLQETIIPRIEV